MHKPPKKPMNQQGKSNPNQIDKTPHPGDDTLQMNFKTVLGPVATHFTNVNTGSWRIVRPMVEGEKCIRCKQCETFCPTAVIEVTPKDSQPDVEPVLINFSYCKGCGICAEVCPKDCIEMKDEHYEK